MQDISIREWIDQNADEARAALIALENNLESYSDGALASAQMAMRRLIVASPRTTKMRSSRR